MAKNRHFFNFNFRTFCKYCYSNKKNAPKRTVVHLGRSQLDCNSHIRFRSMGPFRLRLEPVGSHLITPKPKIKTPLRVFEFLVGAAGFEPTLTESESGVLPLNYAPMRRTLYASYFHFAIKILDFL